MKLVAALSWYMEPPAFLDRCVRSLAGAVDELVALDGAWDGFPHDLPYSTPEEHDVIANAAIETGLPYRIIEHDRPWLSQVQKRDKLMQLACENGASFVLVIDGDEHVASCDREALRRSLELTDRHVATVTFRPMNQGWPYSELPTSEQVIRRIYRAGTRVEVAHNGYRFGNEWLLGDRAYVRLSPALDTSKLIRVDHDNMNRGPLRLRAAKEYRKARREQRLESWRGEGVLR